jgi:hypothetical protein
MWIPDAPKDLMTKFVDCLVQLPNLRTLEIFGVSQPITELLQKRARFPGIRELWISEPLAEFVGSCPNVESVTFTDGLSWDGTEILSSQGKKLKRVAGVHQGYVWQGELRDTFRSEADTQWGYITEVVQGCPDLQEISIKGAIGGVPRPTVGLPVKNSRGSGAYQYCIG